MHAKPPVGDLPLDPASWFLAGHVRQLTGGLRTTTIGGRRILLVKTPAGQLAAMNAQCSHMAADLGRGKLLENGVRCPFHHWRYALDGRCTNIPGAQEIPATAQQSTYPICQRHGYLFVFAGTGAEFPLPFFDDCQPKNFVAGGCFSFHAQCAWYMLPANAFDAQHFHTVHNREFLAPPVVDCPAPAARRIRYRARVTGSSIHDRLLRQFVGEVVDVSITSWGGSHLLIAGRFRRATSRMLIIAEPLVDGTTHASVIVYAPRQPGWARPLMFLNLWMREWFTRGFLRHDLKKLSGIRYQPEGLVEGDHELVAYFHWLAELGRGRIAAAGADDHIADHSSA